MWRVTENGPPDCWIAGLQDHWVAAGSRKSTTPTPELFGPGYCLVRGCCCEPLVAVSQGRSVGSPSGRRRRRHERRALGGACIPAVPRLGPRWYPRQRSSRRAAFLSPRDGARARHRLHQSRTLDAAGPRAGSYRCCRCCAKAATLHMFVGCKYQDNFQMCFNSE